MKSLEESLEFNALYESMWKCKGGKMWKASVARYVWHGIEETLKLEEELANGTYKPRKPHTFVLTYPKRRDCSSTHIRDRIVQRSLNDLIIYPEMTKSFIWDNMACQIGKGTDKAMDRLNTFLHRYYINNGNCNEGWVAQFDIHGYYKHMKHSDARVCFLRHLEDRVVQLSMKWLERQYTNDVGFEPGSQMVQILGISLLDPLDHMIKERLGAKYYERYMDDFFIISNDREMLEFCQQRIIEELKGYSMEVNEDKTKIYPLKNGIKFLGFTYKLTDTGKVIRLINPQNVKHERKKLYRMAALVKSGRMTKRKFYECYNAWKAHASKGNTYKVITRMDQYVKSLWEDTQDESQKA